MPAKRSTNFKKKPSRGRRSPSFVGLAPSSQHASTTKSRNRAYNTKAERMLQKALREARLRFRVHARELPGCPDIVFSKEQVVVFCDGDFWHGRHWAKRSLRLKSGSNARYWLDKIRYNMARDKRQKNALQRAGWLVIRLWETDVVLDPKTAAERVAKALSRSRHRHRSI